MAPGAAYQDHHFRSNANLGPRPTPTIPKPTWSVYAEINIHAPPKFPYEAILDIRSWRDWNTMNPDVLVTKHSRPHSKNLRMEQGAFMTFTLAFTPSEHVQTKEVCQHLEPLKTRDDGRPSHAAGNNTTRIRWTSDNANYLTPGFVIRTERVSEIEEGDGTDTKYRTWISFGGLTAGKWKKKYGEAYREKVMDFCRDLKAVCEKRYKEEQQQQQHGVPGQNGDADLAVDEKANGGG